jgi:hypothetical protein
VRPAEFGVYGVDFTRHFFSTLYGSIDPYSPFGHHPGDTPAALESRLGPFFDRMSAALARVDTTGRWGPLAGVRLEAARLGKENRDAEIHVVGRYDARTHRFVHLWNRQTSASRP